MFSISPYVITTEEDSVARSGPIEMKRSVGLDTSRYVYDGFIAPQGDEDGANITHSL